MNGYKVSEDIEELVYLLQDGLSRDVFWARLRADVADANDRLDVSMPLAIAGGILTTEESLLYLELRSYIRFIEKSHGRVVLYGAGKSGRIWGKFLRSDDVDFYCYCDSQFEQFENGFMGKKVLSPTWLIENADTSYVLITSRDYYEDIYEYLIEQEFPVKHILPKLWNQDLVYERCRLESHYFDFPELFKAGKAFVDGGCYDGEDCIRFAKMCNGEYSQILAFEPDEVNVGICRERLKALERVQVIQLGLDKTDKELNFLVSGTSSSRIVEDGDDTSLSVTGLPIDGNVGSICVTSLDKYTKDIEVGFIKLDIEGNEVNAIKGARETIVRDKPFLAICVYHKKGDILAIMDLIHNLEPSYRFWLRDYSITGKETVLYAAVVS